MPTEKNGLSSSSSGSGASRAGSGSGSGSGSGGVPKKMGSLSSTSLNFRPASPPTPFSGSSSGASASHSSSASSRSTQTSSSSRFAITTSSASTSYSSRATEQDKRRMPPPPPGFRARPQPYPGGRPTKVKAGKGKGKVLVEVLSSDEDEPSSTARDSGQMWTELYAPTQEADLAPGKARIQRVKNWLHEALFGHALDTPPPNPSTSAKYRKYKRVLLLSGPAGTGKTTTVRFLAQQMGAEVVEWSEEVEEWSLGSGIDRESSISKFTSFLYHQSYSALSIPDPSQSIGSSQSSSRPRLILLTALPNLTHLPTREAFHAALLDFCKTFTSASCPMVIVHSDAGASGRAEESWMERERGGREGALEVLGKEVRDGPWCQEVDFLPLAYTFMIKALLRIMLAAIPNAVDRVPQSTIQLLAHSSNGDLRSAINSLQLLCSKRIERGKAGSRKRKSAGGEDDDGPARKKGAGSRGGKGARLNVSEDMRAVLDAVSRREQSLGLFHALGKVFYNKRLGDPNEDEEDQEILSAIRRLPPDEALPTHLKGYTRRKSLIPMDSFIPTIPVDASSFALWLHQSLPAFCTDIEQVAEGVDQLCAADIMRTDDDIWQSSPQAIGYALNLSIRGLLMALPTPVPRRSQKVIKPQFFEAYRLERANAAALDSAAAYLTKKALAASAVIGRERDAGNVDVAVAGTELPRSGTGSGAWSGLLSNKVLACEMIPMMVKIQSLHKRPLLPSSAQTLVLPPYVRGSTQFTSAELTVNDADAAEEEQDQRDADEGLHQGWDVDGEAGAEEGEEGKGEEAFLLDDDIEDW